MQLDYLSLGSTGFTGALKIRNSDTVAACCGCTGGDSSTVVIYDNGSPIDLWECQGCKCQQKAIGDIDVGERSPVLMVAGAVLPEEVCSRNCYSRNLAPGADGLAGAWFFGNSIRGEAMDLVAEGIKLALAQKELAELRKQMQKKTVVLPNVPDPTLDPFARYVESLGCS